LPQQIKTIVIYGKDRSYIDLIRQRNPLKRVKWVYAGKETIFPPLLFEKIPKVSIPPEMVEIKEEVKMPKKKGEAYWWLWRLFHSFTRIKPSDKLEAGKLYRFHFFVKNPEGLSRKLVLLGLDRLAGAFDEIIAYSPLIPTEAGEGRVMFSVIPKKEERAGDMAGKISAWAENNAYLILTLDYVEKRIFRWWIIGLGGLGIGGVVALTRRKK